MSVVDEAAAVLGVAGVACVVVATVLGGRWRLGLRHALDLWLAAGLLRLSGDPSWDQVTAAAALVAARRLIGVGLRIGSHARAAPRPAWGRRRGRWPSPRR